MTELMRSFAGQLNSGSLERAADDLAYSAATLQPTHGRARSQKHPATGSSRSRLSQIGRNGPPDVEGQRQRSFVTTLAVNPQAGLSPINIAQFQKNDFSGAQSKTRKQQQNGPIAKTLGGAPSLTFLQNPMNAWKRHGSWDGRHRPSSYRGNRVGKIGFDIITVPCEAEERAQGKGCILRCRKRTVPRCATSNKIDDLFGAQRGELHLTCSVKTVQKLPHRPQVLLDGRHASLSLW